MSIVTVNAELAVKRLQQNGFDLAQARGIVEVIKASRPELATKGDPEHAIGLLRQDLAIFKRDMIIWVGGIVIATNGVLFALLQFFPPGSGS